MVQSGKPTVPFVAPVMKPTTPISDKPSYTPPTTIPAPTKLPAAQPSRYEAGHALVRGPFPPQRQGSQHAEREAVNPAELHARSSLGAPVQAPSASRRAVRPLRLPASFRSVSHAEHEAERE